MSVCKRVLVLILVMDLTQCLLLRGRMTGFPKNWGPGPPERQNKVDTICTVVVVVRLSVHVHLNLGLSHRDS